MGYDSSGNVASVTKLAGTANAVTTTITHEFGYSQLKRITDPLMDATSFDYYADGSVKSVTDARNKVTQVTNNTGGQPLTIRDATNKVTTLEYGFGDLTAAIDALGKTTRRFVDAAGRTASVADPLSNLTRTDFDVLNRPTKVTDSLTGLTQSTYDANGNRLTVTDARNGVTTFTYDQMERVATRKDPLLRTASYAYDPKGNLSRVTDRLGLVTTYQYDPLNRRTFSGFKTQGTAPNFTYESTIVYTYDGGNRLRTAVDSAAGTITLGFDDLDRETSESSPQGSTTYGYDDAGRRRSMTLAGQPQIAYDYDATDRLKTVTQGSASIVLTYDDAGRLLTTTLANGVVGTYAYDDASHVTSIVYTKDATTVGDLTYSYDAAGHRVTAGGSLARITLPTAVGTTTYNADNQLTKWNSNSVQPTYDANGNMLTDGTYTYIWNARNQLTQLKQGATVVGSYTYDARGRRISKTMSGAVTGFAYEDANFVQEQNASGTPTANLVTAGIDQAFTRTDTTSARYLLTDALGSTLGLTDALGSLPTSYTYEPYGKTTVTGSADGNTQQFTGRENDGSLYYYRARYYNPTFGRFVSEDSANWLTGLDLYSYANLNPISLRDPTGRETFGVCITGGINFLMFTFFEGNLCIVGSTNGQLGVTRTVGAGAGVGVGGSAGLSGLYSTGDDIYDLAGPFATLGGAAAVGVGVQGEGFLGLGHCHQVVAGGTAGVAVGGRASIQGGATTTAVLFAIGRRKSSCD
jgi:RHS repeat-associated protein